MEGRRDEVEVHREGEFDEQASKSFDKEWGKAWSGSTLGRAHSTTRREAYEEPRPVDGAEWKCDSKGALDRQRLRPRRCPMKADGDEEMQPGGAKAKREKGSVHEKAGQEELNTCGVAEVDFGTRGFDG